MPFEEGHNLSSGRPEGSLNKTTILMMDVKDIVLQTFHKMQKDKKVSLLTWGKKNPTEFYKIAAKLIPTQIHADITEKRIIVMAPAKKPKKLKE